MRFSIYMTESSRVDEMNFSKFASGAIEIAKAINSVHDNSVDYYACANSDSNQSMALLCDDIKLATLKLTPLKLELWNRHLKHVHNLLLENCELSSDSSAKARKNHSQAMSLLANYKDFDSYYYVDSKLNVLCPDESTAVRYSFINDLRNFYSFEDVWDK